MFMHGEISLFLHDSTNAYTTRQGSNHYVYHNVAVMVAISNGCLESTTPRECSPTGKGAQEMCEPTGVSILARVNRV